jgi:hypothetical protein
MKKVAFKVVTGLVLASSALLCQVSQAADINRTHFVNLVNGTAGFDDYFTTVDAGKTFLDHFTFTVAGVSDLDAGLISVATKKKFDLDITAFNLFSGSTLLAAGTQSATGGADIWGLSFANLANGPYTLAVEGKVLGSSGGSFGGNVNVSPVPEPSTWAMMLGGFGLLGFLARRRKATGAAGFAAA